MPSAMMTPSPLVLDLDHSRPLTILRPPPSKAGCKNVVFPKRPTHTRTCSSPPTSPGMHDSAMKSVFAEGLGEGPWTPPTTPTKGRKRRSSASAYDAGQFLKAERKDAVEMMDPNRETAVEDDPKDETKVWGETRAREYEGRYELIPGNCSSGYEEYGRGVWSVVYKAMEISTSKGSRVTALGMPTPPASPLSAHPQDHDVTRKYLAIKAPTRRDAYHVLGNEARILTYLHQSRNSCNYVVPFLGYEPTIHSLVLDAIPLTLNDFTNAAAKEARAHFSTRTMFDPVIGVSRWLGLCKDLIDGLAFVHSKKVVHGDIKPMNILCRMKLSSSESAIMEYQPLYCDFSSSHVKESGREPDEVGAVTAEFTAPELLQALGQKNTQKAVATYENDVFGLGVTLLTAAIGETPYAGARFQGQKTAMAKEGVPLEFARRGEQASRVRPKGVVDSVIRGAVDKNSSRRCTVRQWQAALTETTEKDLTKI